MFIFFKFEIDNFKMILIIVILIVMKNYTKNFFIFYFYFEIDYSYFEIDKCHFEVKMAQIPVIQTFLCFNIFVVVLKFHFNTILVLNVATKFLKSII